MKKELEHFYIGDSYGGNQDWFRSFMMRLGGCGAETACDSSLYFALHKGMENLYPFDCHSLTKDDYVSFAHMMEKYLWPRIAGISKLEIYVDGFSKYLKDCGVDCLGMSMLRGDETYETAREALIRQIDAGLPVPILVLDHKDKSLRDYVWHWFLINGYDEQNAASSPESAAHPEAPAAPEPQAKANGSDELLVKAVTYSSYQWLDFRGLWNTERKPKGGLILYEL